MTEQTRTTDFFALVKAGTPQSVQAAISNGAEVNTRDDYGRTPLMWAASYTENPEVISTFLKAGAEVNAQDENGWTPLMAAARDSHNPEVITTFLKAGAPTSRIRTRPAGPRLMQAAR